jgi:hypothetical protein
MEKRIDVLSDRAALIERSLSLVLEKMQKAL